MFECLILIGLIFFFGAFIAFLIKLLFSLVLLPIKLGLWLLKGLLALVLLIPILLISFGAVSAIIPFILAVLALPILIVVGGAVLLAKLFA
ncbi:MAG: hypothetical protein JSW50_14230 [Candidatus Latescibacterota bacterium]|nr:MAG: hypothetical protein JSW50_14230 [Candidatus Latescibacterota bacterium]